MSASTAVFGWHSTEDVTDISVFPKMIVGDQIANLSGQTINILGYEANKNEVVQARTSTEGFYVGTLPPEGGGFDDAPSDGYMYGRMNEAWHRIDRGCPYDPGDILTTTNATPPEARWPGTTWQQLKNVSIVGAGDKFTNKQNIGFSDAVLLSHNHGGATGSITTTSTTTSGGGHPHQMKGYGATLGTGSTGWRFGSSGGQWATGIIVNDGTHSHSYYHLYQHTHLVSTQGSTESAVNRNYHPSYAAYIYIRLT